MTATDPPSDSTDDIVDAYYDTGAYLTDPTRPGATIEPPSISGQIDWENLPCALHNILEPHQDGSIWCPECWHTYWDDADLIATELTEWASMYDNRPPPTVSDIMCCPLCVHDW